MSTSRRQTFLLVALIAVAGLYAYQYYLPSDSNSELPSSVPPPMASPQAAVDKSNTLPFDDETKAEIRQYFEGVSLEPNELTVNEAIRLDHSVGRPQLSQGQFREAYRTYQKVLAISYHEGSLMGIGIALMILADTARRGNNAEEAISTTLLAYKMAKALRSPEEMGVSELAMARILRDTDPSLSVAWLLRAKEHLANSQYKEDYVRALPSFADHLRKREETGGAIAALDEAWGLAQTLGNSPTQKWTKWEVANDYAKDLALAGRHDEAIEVMRNAQTFFADPEKKSEAYTSVLYRLARSHDQLRRTDDAGRYYLSAYASYELSRVEAPGETARAQVDQNHQGLVDAFVQHQLDASDVAEALALLESNKARTLNEVFEDAAYKSTQDQWKAMERKHAEEMTQLLETSDDALAPLPQRKLLMKILALQQQQENERRQWQTRLQLTEMVATKSLTRQQVEKIRQQLPHDVGVLSFFIGDEHAGVFAISRQGLRYIPLAIDSKEYRRTIEQLRVALTNPHTDFYREPAQWLYQSVLAPSLEVLPQDVKVVVYSPDGLLSGVPLEVFMDGDHFLGERLAFYRVPSLRYATSISKAKAQPVSSGIVCVDPDIAGSRLPFQQETGHVIQALYGKQTVPLVGKECSEQKLEAAIRERRTPFFLHIGAHGVFYPSDAMDSMIWLSSDEGNGHEGHEWNAKAMATVDMKHIDLVTLSSCEAGLTDPMYQRDVFGIARALFFAGAQRVVAPLWAVNDQGTAAFMREFHTAYAHKMPAVLALQQAQRTFIAGKKYRHPYYWSAFVLTGAAR